MTQSPWSTSAHAEVSRRSPNWGLYLMLNIGLAVAMGLVDIGVNAATGLSLPSFLVNLIVLVGSTWLAGAQWLKAAGGVWDREDRKRLAFAYTMVNLGLTVLVFALIGLVVASGVGSEALTGLGLTPEVLSGGLVFLAIAMAIMTPLILWAFYGIMRVVLAHFLGGRERSAGTADTFN